MNVETKILKNVTVSDFVIKNNVQNSEVSAKVHHVNGSILHIESGIVKMDGEVIGSFNVQEDGNLSLYNTTSDNISVVANLVNEAISEIKLEIK